MPRYDQTDVALLNLIQQNARLTMKELAAKLNLSTTPVFERLKRLEKEGVVKQYIAILDAKKVGKRLTAFIHISVIDHSKEGLEQFTEQVISYPEVLECHHVTGDADFFLKVVVEDIDQYNQFVTNKLSTVSNIGKVNSSFSLSSAKETTAFELVWERMPLSY